MPTYEPDIRIVLWTGKKFLFLGKEDFRNMSKIAGGAAHAYDVFGETYTTKKDAEFVRVIPKTCTVDMSVDGTGSATLTFVSSQYPVNYLEFRHQMSEADKSNYRSHYLYREGILDYYTQLVNKVIFPNYDLYKRFGAWDMNSDAPVGGAVGETSQSLLAYLFNHTEPVHLFTPPQLVWIMMRRAPAEPWYRVFTGVVADVTVEEKSGTSGTRTISVSCVNLLQFIAKINAVTQKMCNILNEAILEQFEPQERPFLRVYMSSTFADAKTIGFDATAELPWSEVMSRFALAVNRSFGSLTESDIVKMKEVAGSDDFKKRLDGAGFGTPTTTDIDSFYKFCKKYAFFRFKLVDDRRPSELTRDYTYEDVRIEAPDTMHVGDLFQLQPSRKSKDPAPCSVIGRLCYNQDYRALEKTGALETPFRKLVKPLLSVLDMPKQMPISTVIRQFSSQMLMWIHTDGCGNWIVEVPRWNDLPRIFGMEKHARCLNGYYDHDDKYVLNRPFELHSFTETTTPSNLITYLEIPFGHQLADFGKAVNNLFFTGQDIDTQNTLLFGFNALIVEQLFNDIGDLPSTPDGREFLNKFARLQRDIRNQEVFTGNASLVLNPAFQPGRNAFIVHRERLYMVTDVTHSFNSGSGGTTTLTLKNGRPIYKTLEEPWSFFVERFAGKKINNVVPVTGKTDAVVVTSEPATAAEVQELGSSFEATGLTTEGWNKMQSDCYAGFRQCIWSGDFRGRQLYTGPNPALIADMASLSSQLEQFANTRFGSVGEFTLVPSSIIRPNTNPMNAPGDHATGKAIDLSKVTFKTADGAGHEVPHTVCFKTGADSSDTEQAFTAEAVRILVSLGYKESHVYRLSGDNPKVVLYNITSPTELAKFQKCDDAAHQYHLHVKNTSMPEE